LQVPTLKEMAGSTKIMQSVRYIQLIRYYNNLKGYNTGQLSLAIPPWVGAMSTRES